MYDLSVTPISVCHVADTQIGHMFGSYASIGKNVNQMTMVQEDKIEQLGFVRALKKTKIARK